MSEEHTKCGDIDAVIERVRLEAAAAETRQRDAFIASHTSVASGFASAGGSNGRIRRGLARRYGRLRYRLRSLLLRPLRQLARSPMRPATNRAMLQTVNRVEQIEDYLGTAVADLQDQSELLADTKAELDTHLASIDEFLETVDARFANQASEKAMLWREMSRVRMEAQLRLYHLDSLAARLESGLDEVSDDGAWQAPSAASKGALDAFYLAFENACRGDEEDIAAQLRADYLETVQAALAQSGEDGVLDIGCGRGEWLRVLGEAGIEASGIDLSPVMAEHCRGQGLDVVVGDAVQALAELPAESRTVVSGFHIIEHLPFAVLYRLFEEVARVLRPDGVFIFETPNPENVLVGSHTFYHDATHSNPLTPTATSFLAEYHGFHPVEIRRLHPYPPQAQVPGRDPLTERVNGHLCGPQDYALIGQKPPT
jgi:O-antigen chain-terminating methyltransferase